MMREIAGQYLVPGGARRASKRIIKLSGSLPLPVIIELSKETPYGAGLIDYMLHIYYPDCPEGNNWIRDKVLPTLYEFNMGKRDLGRIQFESWVDVKDNLGKRLASERVKGARVIEALWYVHFD